MTWLATAAMKLRKYSHTKTLQSQSHNSHDMIRQQPQGNRGNIPTHCNLKPQLTWHEPATATTESWKYSHICAQSKATAHMTQPATATMKLWKYSHTQCNPKQLTWHDLALATAAMKSWNFSHTQHNPSHIIQPQQLQQNHRNIPTHTCTIQATAHMTWSSNSCNKIVELFPHTNAIKSKATTHMTWSGNSYNRIAEIFPHTHAYNPKLHLTWHNPATATMKSQNFSHTHNTIQSGRNSRNKTTETFPHATTNTTTTWFNDSATATTKSRKYSHDLATRKILLKYLIL